MKYLVHYYIFKLTLNFKYNQNNINIWEFDIFLNKNESLDIYVRMCIYAR